MEAILPVSLACSLSFGLAGSQLPNSTSVGDGWERLAGNSTCYYVSSEEKFWNDSLRDCQVRGGSLLSFSNLENPWKLFRQLWTKDISAQWWTRLNDDHLALLPTQFTVFDGSKVIIQKKVKTAAKFVCEKRAPANVGTYTSTTTVPPAVVNSLRTEELIPTEAVQVMNAVDAALAAPGALSHKGALWSAVQSMSKLAGAGLDVLVGANRIGGVAQRLLQTADKIAAEGQVSNGRFVLSADNLVVAAWDVEEDTEDVTRGLSLTAVTPSFGQGFKAGDVNIEPSDFPSKMADTSLFISSSLMRNISGSRVALIVHKDDGVFEAIRRSTGNVASYESDASRTVTRINSHVLSATIVEKSVTDPQKAVVRHLKDLDEPVTYTLVHHDQNADNPRCVFWDTATSDWSRQGCHRDDARSSATLTTCKCDHFTNFALLMDVHKTAKSLSVTDSKIMSFFSYISCGVSLLALILTILTNFVMFRPMSSDPASDSSRHRRPRRKWTTPAKILVHLSSALALSNLVFVAGVQSYALQSAVGCKAVAVLLHFSLLASLCWMAVEGFNLLLALVVVFDTHFSNYIVKCCLVGWGIPAAVVVVTLVVSPTDNYGYLSTGVCWLRGTAFYAAFVGPVGFILLVNTVIFLVVGFKLCTMDDRRTATKTSSSPSAVLQRWKRSLGVAILLGLTWIFGFLAWGAASVVFYYLFVVFNCSQGLWIFLFYCVANKEARQSWLGVLPRCGASRNGRDVTTTTSNAQGESTL